MESSDFLPVVVRRGFSGRARLGSETRKWNLARSASSHLPHGAVTGLTFSPLSPHDVAAASGPSVAILDPQTGSIRRTIARFKDVAHSPDYKPDGRLLTAGSENGTVQVFDLSSRAVLRIFKGHGSAVHSSRFTADGLRIISGCDDGVVRAWDLGTSNMLFALRGSADYVRAQAASPASKHIWATGSYDRRARIYDLRTRQVLFTLDHGSQVDDIVLLPGGARAVTLGGPDIKVWDFFAGGKMVMNLRSHAKAVTCGVLSSTGDRLLTGGLDGQVKVHDVSTMAIISSMFFDGQILSIASSPQINRIAVGLVDGTIDVRTQKGSAVRRESSDLDLDGITLSSQHGKLKENMFEGWGRGFEKERRRGPRPGSVRYMMRGPSAGVSDSRDVVIGKRRLTGLKEYDIFLRKFAYGDALDSALKTRKASVVASVVSELVGRGGLQAALSGRSIYGIRPVLLFIARKISDSRYTALLSQLAESTLELYGDIFGENLDVGSVDRSLVKILAKVKREISIIRSLCAVDGMLTVVGSARIANDLAT